jgi:hypothetical protein
VLSQIYDQLVARGCRIGWRVTPLPVPEHAPTPRSGYRPRPPQMMRPRLRLPLSRVRRAPAPPQP